MDFTLTEEQKGIKELAQKVFAKLATPEKLREGEGADFFSRPLWEALAQAGLLGLLLPEALGGTDAGFLGVCALLEEQGRAVAPVPLLPTLIMGVLPLLQFGSEAQKRRCLEGVAAGRTILTAALLDDPDAEVTAEADSGKGVGTWRLHGTKTCVPAFDLARHVLVAARSKDGTARLYVCDKGASGMTAERQVATTGEPLFRLRLQDVRVTADNVLGSGAGNAALDFVRQRVQIATCVIAGGVAQRQLELISEYTVRRQQFERPIASFQAVAQRAADAYIAVEAIKLTTWQAAWRLSAGLPADKEVALAKYFAAEAGQAVANAAQHLHGGMGVDRGYPLYRYYLWARQLELSLGGAAVHLSRLGAALAKETHELREAQP